MASAMASLVTGATVALRVHVRASRRAISRGQRAPQLVNAGVRGVRMSGQWLRSSGSDGASWSQFDSRIARSLSAGSSVVVYAASSSSSEASSRAGNSAMIASAVMSRAILLVAVVARAVVRAANSLGSTLTASPLPDGSTNAEKELVTALKGRLVLAVGPLFFASISQTPGAVSTPLTVVASGMAKWLELYSGVLMVRVLLSWFPNIPWERQPLQAVRDMCDPYLNLFRNIIPPLFNALDLSPMLAFMVLGVLTSILNTTAR